MRVYRARVVLLACVTCLASFTSAVADHGPNEVRFEVEIDLGTPTSDLELGPGITETSSACEPGGPGDGIDGAWFSLDAFPEGTEFIVKRTSAAPVSIRLHYFRKQGDVCTFRGTSSDTPDRVNGSTWRSRVPSYGVTHMLLKLEAGVSARFTLSFFPDGGLSGNFDDGCGGKDPAVPPIAGNNGDDVLIGTPGNDVLIGGYGDDVIVGGGGDDWICGNQGNDTIYGDDAPELGIFVEQDGVSHGNDTLNGGPGADHVVGGDGDDVLGENPQDYHAYGPDYGHDLLDGGRGNDQLIGWSGGTLQGGLGRDTYSCAASCWTYACVDSMIEPGVGYPCATVSPRVETSAFLRAHVLYVGDPCEPEIDVPLPRGNAPCFRIDPFESVVDVEVSTDGGESIGSLVDVRGRDGIWRPQQEFCTASRIAFASGDTHVRVIPHRCDLGIVDVGAIRMSFD